MGFYKAFERYEVEEKQSRLVVEICICQGKSSSGLKKEKKICLHFWYFCKTVFNTQRRSRVEEKVGVRKTSEEASIHHNCWQLIDRLCDLLGTPIIALVAFMTFRTCARRGWKIL